MNKYFELLKHPKWQKKRLEILERDNFTCQLCGDKETCLNIHHKKYISNRKPWKYDNEDLITLCEDCHNTFEKLKKYYSSIGNKDINTLSILKLTNETSYRILFVLEQSKFCTRLHICERDKDYWHVLGHITYKGLKKLSKFLIQNHV